MKNALLLTTIWVAILLTAYAIVYWDQGIDEPFPISVLDEEAEASYVDPDGSFSLTLPLGWDVEPGDVAVELVSPDENLGGWIVSMESDDLEAAVDVAWEMVDPAFDASLLAIEPIEPEQAVRAVYDGEEAGETIYGIALGADGLVVVMLVRGRAEVAEAYADDLEEVLEGLAVPAYEATLL